MIILISLATLSPVIAILFYSVLKFDGSSVITVE